MARPTPADESALPPDRAPASDSESNHDADRESRSHKPKVTPLDPDNNLKDGIEVNET